MNILKHLWLAILLILAASVLLLLSDLKNRKAGLSTKSNTKPNIALMQIASTPLLDSHVAGIKQALREKNLLEKDESNLRVFNPQGDYTTATTIAREMVNGNYDLLMTSSTVALQVVANANQSVRKPHVFGAVTYPQGAGVGINGTKPKDHPPYLTGIGTFQPVRQAIRIAKELNPHLQRIGVVWNPGEKCSEACVLEARDESGKQGIELIEATASGTSEVSEALRSLLAKKVEAIWIGGDTVAISSLPMIVHQANQVGIPVFTNDPLDADKGALFGLGADYQTVGRYAGEMAAEVLNGKSPAEFAIENVVPKLFRINRQALNSFLAWNLTNKLQKLVAQSEKKQTDMASRGKPASIVMINLVNNPVLEAAEHGVEAGLKSLGLQPGKDYALKKLNAQGEMTQLPQLVDSAIAMSPDLIITVTTPALITAAKKVKNIPLVFTVASDPKKVGIFDKQRPENICGVYDSQPVAELVEMILRYQPDIKTLGTVYDPSEINSMISVEKLRNAVKKHHLKLVEATAGNVSELPMATQSLIERGAEALVVSADNLAITGFSAIRKNAATSNIPVFTTETSLMNQGAAGAVGNDYFAWGQQSGKLAGHVLTGTAPLELPIEPVSENTIITPSKAKIRERINGH
jgi:ABC-type uncharacterized transport system substrate-binding protein